MAKSKYATALFEVMNRQKSAAAAAAANGKGGHTGPAGLCAPKWWFKSRNNSDVKTMAPGESSISSAVAEPPSPRPSSSPAMVPPLASSIDVSQVNPAAPAPRVQPVAVSVDPDRQQISLRLSYTSALIGGFSIFIALGLAVLIGKSLSRGPATAIANTSTQVLRQNPPTPGVMNVPRRAEVNGANDVVEGARTAVPASTGTRVPQQTFSEPRPPSTFFTDDPHRQNGLNYVIIQSYPNKETADKAAEFLTKHGVTCTVEKNLPNWRLPWNDGCVVVGIRGFAKVTNNPSLEAYRKSIMDVSAKFTSNRAGFVAFAPTMYLWKKSN
jgi:hypothetical protein